MIFILCGSLIRRKKVFHEKLKFFYADFSFKNKLENTKSCISVNIFFSVFRKHKSKADHDYRSFLSSYISPLLLNYLQPFSNNRCGWVGKKADGGKTKLRNNDDKHPRARLRKFHFELFSFFSVPFKPSKFYFVRQFLREGLQRSNYQLGASSLFACPTLSVVFLAEECFPGLLRGMPTHKIASRDKNKFQPFFSSFLSSSLFHPQPICQ